MAFGHTFLEKNQIFIYFGYGLAFFVMGLTVALRYRRSSSFHLARSLPYLAAFGILHGFAVWGYLLIPIQALFLYYSMVILLKVLHMSLFALSFLSLAYFGAKLLSDTLRGWYWLKWLFLAFFAVWFVIFVALRPLTITRRPDVEWWLLLSNLWARYLLAAPGAMLAGFAIWTQIKQAGIWSIPKAARHLRWAAASFFAYSLIGGIVVPEAPFFFASRLNETNFFLLTGLPVEIFRALDGLVMAYFITRVLEIFEIERALRLEVAERERTLLEERLRISQDLHDGVIQSLYACGLTLENFQYLADEDPGRLKQETSQLMGRLDGVIRDLRSYIMDLKPVDFQETDLATGLEGLITEFRANSLLEVALHYDPSAPRQFPQEAVSHLYHIVREALSNVAKHARATTASIQVRTSDGDVILMVRDNGKGFDPHLLEKEGRGQGLRNIRSRAAAIGAKVRVHGHPGTGTELILILPRGGGDQ